MHNQFKDKNDIKIFILYLMMNIRYPLEFDDINDIVVQDEIVGCIDFAECFAQLLETGNIEELSEDGVLKYRITERGVQVADTLQSSIVSYIRTRSLKSALKLLSFKQRGAKINSSATKRDDGRYDLVLTISEKQDTPLQIKVIVDNETQLERIKYNFDEKPELIYRSVLALLSGEANYLLE